VLLKNIGVPAVTGPKIDGSRQYFFKRADMLSKKNAIAKTEGA
jgi:hypothetical protein